MSAATRCRQLLAALGYGATSDAPPVRHRRVSFSAEPPRVVSQRTAADYVHRLPLGLMLAYSSVCLSFSSIDFVVRPARVTVYREALGMDIATMSMIIAICKSVDLLSGLVVGKVTDSVRTRWGRRKPFIAVCGPLFVVAMLALCSPPCSLRPGGVCGGAAGGGAGGGAAAPAPCAAEAAAVNRTSWEGCIALKSCVERAIDAGALPASGVAAVVGGAAAAADGVPSVGASDAPSGSAGLALYFGAMYFLYYFLGPTCTYIPYEALGLELTSDYHEKTRLFGVKVAGMFGGYLLQTAAGLALGSLVFAGDNLGLVASQAVLFGGLLVVSLLALLWVVVERDDAKVVTKDDASAVPLIPSVMRCLRNRPYRLYLATKIPLALAALLPSNLLLDYLRYCVRLEDYMSMYFVSMGIALLSIFVSIAFTVPATKKYGKSTTLAFLCTLEGCAFLLGFFVPPSYVRGPALYAMPVVLGVGMAAGFLIPAAMLADVVDYDELRTGERSEGLYTVVETNVQQFVEIVGGVLPGIIASAAGYRNQGGCSCGCGVACPLPYERWRCDADIGYACSQDYGAPLLADIGPEPASASDRMRALGFFGQPGRLAACTAQPEGVQWIFRFFFVGLPALFFLVAAIPAAAAPINEKVHAAILKELKRRALDGGAATDPLSGAPLPLPGNSAAELFEEHFTAAELDAAANRRGVHTLRSLVGRRLAASIGALLVLVAAMVASGGEEAVVTFGCLLLAVVFILIPWDGGRLRLLYKSAADAPSSLRVLDDDDVNGGFGAVHAHRFARELR